MNRLIGYDSGFKCTNEDNYVIQKFARAVLGTNNVGHCARLCHASIGRTPEGMAESPFGDGTLVKLLSRVSDRSLKPSGKEGGCGIS